MSALSMKHCKIQFWKKDQNKNKLDGIAIECLNQYKETSLIKEMTTTNLGMAKLLGYHNLCKEV